MHMPMQHCMEIWGSASTVDWQIGVVVPTPTIGDHTLTGKVYAGKENLSLS